MTIGEVVQKSSLFLKNKNFPEARLETEKIISFFLQCERVDLYLKWDCPLNSEEIAKLRELIVRRSLGEPLAYILGYQYFYNHKFLCKRDVFIPRPETELIVEKALKHLEKRNTSSSYIYDWGCGTGALGLSILKECSDLHLLGFDKNPKAIELSNQNAQNLGLSERSNWFLKDINKEEISQQTLASIIVANPPYIHLSDPYIDKNVKDFEPHDALFSEEEGLQDLKKWALLASQFLLKKGLVLFEFGFKQSNEIQRYFENLQVFENIQIFKDLQGHPRVLQAEKRDK